MSKHRENYIAQISMDSRYFNRLLVNVETYGRRLYKKEENMGENF
jgi:hypothetical protein